MLFVAMPQAAATWFLGLSVLTAAQAPGPLNLRDAFGVLLMAAALWGEHLADRQMKAFKADPANQGKVCDTGLWGWSRHPNYFFQWLGWLAYPVIALNHANPHALFSVAAPVVMFILLNKVSGIPPLEAAQLKSKGQAYRAYQRRVSPFIPLPRPRGAKVPAA
jgi:steroid 5-alpha reductase family enzyme